MWTGVTIDSIDNSFLEGRCAEAERRNLEQHLELDDKDDYDLDVDLDDTMIDPLEP